MYNILDLFSGAGGMAEGFIQAGFNIPKATDISKDASITYVKRHSQIGKNVDFFCGDIRILSDENNLKRFLGSYENSIDVIIGGPPCQGFSLAGKRSKNDPRNYLVSSYIKIVSIIKPKAFVFENVIGILSSKFEKYDGISCTYHNENVLDVLEKEFKNIGYEIESNILNASDYGVPQNRRRIIITGKRNEYKLIKIQVPRKKDTKISVYEAISDLSINRPNSLSNYQKDSINGRTIKDKNLKNDICFYNNEKSSHSELVIKRFSLMREGETINELLDRLKEPIKTELSTKKNKCYRLDRNQQSPTIMTLPDDIIHYEENRILSVREMARLQSFDDSFIFYGKRTTGGKLRKVELPQYTQVGNAVPPLLAKAIAEEVLTFLKEVDRYGEIKL